MIDNKDLFLDLDCTCPLRKLSDIKKLSRRFFDIRSTKKFDAIFTVTEARRTPYFNIMEERRSYMEISKKTKKQIIRRQDAPKVYEHCGVGYALKPNFLLKKNNFLEGKLIGHKVSLLSGLDIDNKIDFKILEMLSKNEKKFN